ncbi:hypothetical protein [Campylobacter ureolyticus]|uniref:hypothetical protein n=1 Tax=Campylobacter ureolyticus TaxID=827 RepID=UPI00215B6FF5|nr:hypothetical protein [Campylobacter ureolyticus]MCR8700335.1 hypothetical protein [Campylobacter ureolyticus]
MLVNKIANARSARGKEKVAYSNFRRGVEVPQAPEQTNSQVFENIKMYMMTLALIRLYQKQISHLIMKLLQKIKLKIASL